MKLLICMECEDIVKLTFTDKHCSCGKSGGRYVDELNAVIHGPCEPLGFANKSFIICTILVATFCSNQAGNYFKSRIRGTNGGVLYRIACCSCSFV